MANNRNIRVTTLTPTIGALVDGVDLNEVDSDATYAAIKDALWAHHVLFFRDQKLAPEAHLRLGRVFGELDIHDFMPNVDGHPEIQVVAHEGYGISNTAFWHTDMTFRARPTMVSILKAADLPTAGGDTLWCSTAAAFDALPDPLKTMLLGLDAEHDLAFHRRKRQDFTGRGLGRSNERVREGWSIEDETAIARANPPVVHPAVINHPVTGRLTLFVNSNWTKKFIDMDPELSDALLTMLWAWVKKPEFQVRYRWQTNSVAIWDNFATQHYAVLDYAPERREMHRVIAGFAEPRLNIETVPAPLRPPAPARALSG